ncbi:MAG: hypothetical protein ABIR91_05415 [Candidatus Saccharimonadales bacterium]
METIRPKSPETLQSQLAAYSTEHVKNKRDFAHVMRTIGDHALSRTESISRITGRCELDYLPAYACYEPIPEYTQRTIITHDDYTAYLRHVRGSRNNTIQGRTDILHAYTTFFDPISMLKADVDATMRLPCDHPDYIGSGLYSSVYRIELGGVEYAARMPHNDETAAAVVDQHIEGALYGNGVPGLEQIIAASYETGLTVAEIVPGKQLGDLSLHDIQSISGQQLKALVTTISTADERGIRFDYNTANYLYDNDKGFGIIDYTSTAKDNERASASDTGRALANIGSEVLLYMGSNNRRSDTHSETEYLQAIHTVMCRYKAEILKTDLSLTGRLSVNRLERYITAIEQSIVAAR